jgi:hypothetical protein
MPTDIFRSAAHYCLDEKDLSEILDTEHSAIHLYLNGVFQAACRVLRYELRNQSELT